MPDVSQRLSKLGVWFFTEVMAADDAAAFAQRLEAWGYSALWMPETTGRDPIAHAAFLATRTEQLLHATGICNIYHRHPAMMIQGARTLAEQTGGRFILGIGVSHKPFVEGLRQVDYGKPVASMRKYLESMQTAPYGAIPPKEDPPIVLAALGPKMLALSGELADGAHPYWTTPEHTAQAREILGPDKLLCVEQKIILTTDRDAALRTARQALAIYKALPNYRNNWKRLGFSDDEIDLDGGSAKLVDALVGWGNEQAIGDRIQAHLDAGASHVCIQPMSVDAALTPDPRALEAFAPGV